MKIPSSLPSAEQPIQHTAADSGETLHRRVLTTCSAKVRRVLPLLVNTRRSGAYSPTGQYFDFPEAFFSIGNWTSSFFTGMALLDFEVSGDRTLLKQVNRMADLYHEKVTRQSMDTMHDLGFLYSLYSVGLYKLTGALDHRATAITAAGELAKRFVPSGNYIRAWGRLDDHSGEYAGLAIIDCMMNLPLLFWATQETGNRFYHEIAVRHADTALACFIRPDDSVNHAFRFDLTTGAPSGPANYCGHRADTHWARGTAWAIYGFALAYRYTKDGRYLDAAQRVARKFITLLGKDGMPVWDFRLPATMPPLLDTSAAAIAVCGLQELLASSSGDAHFADAADRMLDTLCACHVDHDINCLGVLRDAQVGDGTLPGSNAYQARNAYTSWGDYFLMEALARRLRGQKSFW